MVQNPRDEMFRLMNASMSQWRQLARAGPAAAGVAGGKQKGAAASMGKSNKKQADKEESKVAKPAFTPDTTVPGEKKDMSRPMEDQYHPK